MAVCNYIRAARVRLQVVSLLQETRKKLASYSEDTVPVDVLKLCFIGPAGAGKTTLKEAIKRGWIDYVFFANENKPDNADCVSERTVGIDVVTVDIGIVGKASLWDYAGQDLFHKVHGLFFSSRNSVFILVLNMTVDEWTLFRDAKYWLGFLLACLGKRERPRILIVGSRGDRCAELGFDGKKVLQKILDCVKETFGERLILVEHTLVLDCRKSWASQMGELKAVLGEIKEECQKVSCDWGVVWCCIVCHVRVCACLC